MVARHEGRVVFVADAIPGERVRAQVSDASKDAFWRAETVEVLAASPHRRAHVWAEADVRIAPSSRPGGADLGHIEIGHQRALKRRVLAEALDRFAGGGIEAPEIEDIGGAEEGWRTRVTLHVDADGRVGPFAARSHRVVPVADHPLARPAVAEAARELAGTAGRRHEGRIELVEPADGRVRVLERADDRPRPATKAQSGGGRRSRRPARPVPEVIRERVGDREFLLDVNGFWQVHAGAAATLDAVVADLLAGRVDPDAAHLDLYGGVGLFAATLGRLGARRITTVEASARATQHARANLEDLGVEAVTARADRFLAALREGDDGAAVAGGAVVLDPPRAGAGRAVVEAVAGLGPASIAYVACDPVALARDLGTFRGLGYEAEELRALDLFPHSHHFEAIALLTPAGRRGGA
nr:class I SAM-dependent RNA methyltransferase [Microbacterium resistens]